MASEYIKIEDDDIIPMKFPVILPYEDGHIEVALQTHIAYSYSFSFRKNPNEANSFRVKVKLYLGTNYYARRTVQFESIVLTIAFNLTAADDSKVKEVMWDYLAFLHKFNLEKLNEINYERNFNNNIQHNNFKEVEDKFSVCHSIN